MILVKSELVNTFGKTETEAIELMDKANLREEIMNDPMALHDSPYLWATHVLGKLKDYVALKAIYRNP